MANKKNNNKKNLFDKLALIENQDAADVTEVSIEKETRLELMTFLKNYIYKVNKENQLKDILISTLLNRITPEDEYVEEHGINVVPLTNTQLIKLLDVVLKNDTDASNGILQILKQNIIIAGSQEIDIPSGNSEKPGDDYTKEDINNVKNVLQFMEEIREAEFTHDK